MRLWRAVAEFAGQLWVAALAWAAVLPADRFEGAGE